MLAVRLEELENIYLKDWGLKSIFGGFVECELDEIDWDNQKVYITCRSGVLSDVENRVTTETLELDIYTLEVLN